MRVVVVPCVDFADAEGGVLSCHVDSHHYMTRIEIVSAVMKISRLMPHSNAASERTFSQGNINKIGKEYCSELILETFAACIYIINWWVTRSFAQPQLFSECPNNTTLKHNFTDSTTHVTLVDSLWQAGNIYSVLQFVQFCQMSCHNGQSFTDLYIWCNLLIQGGANILKVVQFDHAASFHPFLSMV